MWRRRSSSRALARPCRRQGRSERGGKRRPACEGERQRASRASWSDRRRCLPARRSRRRYSGSAFPTRVARREACRVGADSRSPRWDDAPGAPERQCPVGDGEDVLVTAAAAHAPSAPKPLSKRRRIGIWALIVVASILGIRHGPDPVDQPPGARQRQLAANERGPDRRSGRSEHAVDLPRRPALRQRGRRRRVRGAAPAEPEGPRRAAGRSAQAAGHAHRQSSPAIAASAAGLGQLERGRAPEARQRAREQDGERHRHGQRGGHARPARAPDRARNDSRSPAGRASPSCRRPPER